jgi:hypothetical protein
LLDSFFALNLQLNMRLNLVLLFLVSVTSALSAIYWKVDKDFFTEKIRWNEAQSRSQLSALTHAVEAEIEGLTQIIDLSFPALNEARHDYGSEQAYSRFHMISRLQKGADGEWLLSPAYYLEKSAVRSWAGSYTNLALRSLKESDIQKGVILSLLDPQRKPWFLLVATSPLTQIRYAAILPTDAFQAIVDRQKGGLSQISLINNQAQVIAHSIPEYIGSRMSEDAIVEEFTQNGQASGSGFFSGLEGEKVHGFYAQAAHTNLYVTVATPLDDLLKERGAIKTRFIYLGVGVVLIGLAFLLLFSGSENSEEVRLLQPVAVQRPSKKIEEVILPAAKAPEAIEKPTMMPPVPPPLHDRTGNTEKFENLFGDRKVAEAFDMIDNLEAPPRGLAPEPIVEALPEPEEPDTMVIAPLHLNSEPLLEQKMPDLINLQRKDSKLDEFTVVIRKPGEIL